MRCSPAATANAWQGNGCGWQALLGGSARRGCCCAVAMEGKQAAAVQRLLSSAANALPFDTDIPGHQLEVGTKLTAVSFVKNKNDHKSALKALSDDIANQDLRVATINKVKATLKDIQGAEKDATIQGIEQDTIRKIMEIFG